jgi:hypothetical protein
MDWSKMTYRQKRDFFRRIEGQTVFIHSSSYRAWGAIHIFGPMIEISFGCRQLGMDSSGSMMIFTRIGEIVNVKEEENGPSYIISVA